MFKLRIISPMIMILMILAMNNRQTMLTKATISTIPRNGMIELTNKLWNLRINSRLNKKRKVQEDKPKEKPYRRKRIKEEFHSNNKNKRGNTRLLWLMVNNTLVKPILLFMAFSRTKSMLEGQTKIPIPTTLNNGMIQ